MAKKYYRVVGSNGAVDTVLADGPASALKLAHMLEVFWTAHTITVSDATLKDIERAALADWNAGRPTASPLALAQARGEL